MGAPRIKNTSMRLDPSPTEVPSAGTSTPQTMSPRTQAMASGSSTILAATVCEPAESGQSPWIRRPPRRPNIRPLPETFFDSRTSTLTSTSCDPPLPRIRYAAGFLEHGPSFTSASSDQCGGCTVALLQATLIGLLNFTSTTLAIRTLSVEFLTLTAVDSPPSTAHHPIMFFLLWNNGSPSRHTFLPSNLTSNEYIMNSHSPLIELLMTPPTLPASSPALIEYLAPLTIGISPSQVTLVGPPEVSDDLPMLG